MFILPSAISGYLAPNFDLAHRYKNGEVLIGEDLLLRIVHLAKALRAIPECLFPTSPDNFHHTLWGLLQYQRTGGYHFKKHIYAVFFPYAAAQAAYRTDCHRLAWGACCIAIKVALGTAVADVLPPSLANRTVCSLASVLLISNYSISVFLVHNTPSLLFDKVFYLYKLTADFKDV